MFSPSLQFLVNPNNWKKHPAHHQHLQGETSKRWPRFPGESRADAHPQAVHRSVCPKISSQGSGLGPNLQSQGSGLGPNLQSQGSGLGPNLQSQGSRDGTVYVSLQGRGSRKGHSTIHLHVFPIKF